MQVPETRYARVGDLRLAYQKWGDGPPLMGFDRQPDGEQEETGGHDDHGEDHGPGDFEERDVGVHQHHGSQDHRDDTGHREQSVAGDLDLRDEQDAP